MIDAINALQTEADSYSQGVRIWMQIMAGSYFAGIFFVLWRREALWIVLMAIFTFAFLIIGKILDPTLTRSVLGSVIHLILWPLALFLLWSPGARNHRRTHYSQGILSSVFSAWLVWVTALILISLVMDAKFLISLMAVT